MDFSQRHFLFNQMMQALELGDKEVADKIESYLRDYNPASPVPIPLNTVFSSRSDAPDFVFLSTSDSDSSDMAKTPSAAGGGRRGPRTPRDSLVGAQTVVGSDVEDHRRDALCFAADRPSSFVTEVNVVGERELSKYRKRYDIPSSVVLIPSGDRAVWNPPSGAVAIYGSMFGCGVTLPLQPFIARFLADAKIAPAQLSPNSYRILMALAVMWKSMGRRSPTPREIRHFYVLRQSGHGGTYYLQSTAVESWIPEGVSNAGQVEISSDKKKIGFIWGFPTSNKRWKNSWFFAGGEWGRNNEADPRRNLRASRVPRHFTSPDAWTKASPVLTPHEVKNVTDAAVLSLIKRGQEHLLDEARMVTCGVFPRLSGRRRRCKFLLEAPFNFHWFLTCNNTMFCFSVSEFDIICDEQARAVKNAEATSQRHAAGLHKEGVAPPDGDDSPDAGAGGVPDVVEVVAQPRVGSEDMPPQVPSRKGKEKVGVPEASVVVPVFDANVPEPPQDPSNDLHPRVGREKRPAETTPEGAARPLKRASRVVQFVVSSDEEDGEPARPEAINVSESGSTIPQSADPASRSEENVETNAPSAATIPVPDNAGPSVSPANIRAGDAAVQEDTPRPSFPFTAEGRDNAAPAGVPGPSSVPAADLGGSQEGPSVGPTVQGEGSATVSLSDFSPAEFLNHFINNDIYFGEGWGKVKGKNCNNKMEFFFNCHSLVVSLVSFLLFILSRFALSNFTLIADDVGDGKRL